MDSFTPTMPGQQPQQLSVPMPDANEYKAKQTNILATLIPQIMNAMGGGDERVARILQDQQNQYQQNIKKQNLMGFMRTISMKETGEITPELIMNQSKVWGVEPQQAMAAVSAFNQFRQAKRGDKQKYFRQMPEGGTQSIEAYADDPILSQLGGWMQGEYKASEPGAMPFGASSQGIFDKRTGNITSPAPQKQMSLRDMAFSRLSQSEQRQALLGQGRTSVNIRNLPKPPKGYWYNKDQSGLEVIPGGPVEREQNEAARKEIRGRVFKQIGSDLVNQSIESALPMIDNMSTGVPGLVTGNIPGTTAHDLQNTLDTIEANIAFDKLQAMRDASPTGGALGQVSERELDTLQKAFGSLKRTQSKEQLRSNLTELQKTYNRIVHGNDAASMMDVTQDMRKKSTQELLKMMGM